MITLGEGWHNNHHRYMSATRNGFYWWEIDVTYYLLKMLSWTGLIWGAEVRARVCARGGGACGPSRVGRRGGFAQHVHPEYSSLKRIVPAAAAIAVATVNAASPILPRRVDTHEIHRDPASLAEMPRQDASP